MKVRWVWRYVFTYNASGPLQTWWGTCPQWAREFDLDRGTLTRTRVMVVGGKTEACHYGHRHAVPTHPFNEKGKVAS
jgi:hypothetical protein